LDCAGGKITFCGIIEQAISALAACWKTGDQVVVLQNTKEALLITASFNGTNFDWRAMQ
jgi:hypothetical protein